MRVGGDRELSRRLLRRRLAMAQEAAEQPAFALARDEIDVADELGAALGRKHKESSARKVHDHLAGARIVSPNGDML